jgi:hypothetical protein
MHRLANNQICLHDIALGGASYKSKGIAGAQSQHCAIGWDYDSLIISFNYANSMDFIDKNTPVSCDSHQITYFDLTQVSKIRVPVPC